MEKHTTRLIDLLLQRRFHPPKLVVVGVLTLLLGWSASRVTFSFELEELFPKGNEDLAFYEEHVGRFGYDNDYLTIVLIPPRTIYDSAFVAMASKVVSELREIEGVLFAFSPLEMPRMVASPFGLTAFPLFDDPGNYGSDSLFIQSDPLLRELVPNDALSILVRHDHLTSPATEELFREILTATSHFNGQARFVGRLPGERAFLQLVRDDFLVFLMASLTLCLLVLWWISRRLSLTLMPLAISGMTLLWTFGIMGLLGIPITIMTSLLPPIVLFVSSSDTIHLISALRNSADRREAIEKVFFPTLMTSVTTAVGFFSLLVLPVGPLQSLGLLAGIATVLAFVLTYLLAPNFPEDYRPGRKIDSRTFKRYAQWLWRRQWSVALVIALLALAGTYYTSQLEVDAYLLDDLPPDTEVRSDFQWADTHLGGSKPWELSLSLVDSGSSWWDLDVQGELDQITAFVEATYGASHVLSPSKAMRYAAYIESGRYTLPDRITSRTVNRARRLLHELRVPLISEDGQHARITGVIPELGSAETAARDDLLGSFLAEHIDAGVLSYRLTGSTYMIDRSHDLLAKEIARSLLLAIAIVSVTLGLYFRSLKTALVALVPNLVPLVLVGGVIAIMGVPIQLSTSIIFALVFGIVVDDSIHFLATYRNALGHSATDRALYAMNTAGRGMINTTLVLLTGFGVLVSSNFGATHYLGLFLCLSLVIALAVDFTLLPLLLKWTKLKGRPRS